LKGNSFTVFDIFKTKNNGWVCDIKEVSIPHKSKEITSKETSSLGKFQISKNCEANNDEK
jgi:hypothetical protein